MCKSGVFLREIVKRLDKGLKNQIPDKQTRINHILKNQVFGIAITGLTALLSRRSVYCSKIANSPLSICEEFDNDMGNIIFGAAIITLKMANAVNAVQAKRCLVIAKG